MYYVISAGNVTKYAYSFVSTPMLILSPGREIILANPGAALYFNRPANTLKGLPAEDLFDFDGQDCAKMGAGEKRFYDAGVKGLSAQCRIEVSGISDNYGEPLCLVFIIHDVTEKSALVREMENEKQRAEAANYAKNIFLERSGRAIRAPMNAAAAMAGRILEENTPRSVEEQALGIKQSSAKALSIIDDLIDYSRIELGKFSLEPVQYRLTSLINDVITTARAQILSRPVLFITKIDSLLPNLLTGDAPRVRQILLKLLANAVRYTREGFISLSVLGEISGNSVNIRISVEDSGTGLKEAEKNRLFGESGRLDREAGREAGRADDENSGLTLTLTRDLAELMGGSLSFESKYGKGSAFTVTIPQKVSSPLEPPKEAGKPPLPSRADRFASVDGLEEKNILFYTPKEAYGDSYRWSAENLGVPCAIALKQSEFIEALEQRRFSHIMVSHVLFPTAEQILGKMGNNENRNARLVEINEYGVSRKTDPETCTIYIPVHTMSIANVLNDKPMGYVLEDGEGNSLRGSENKTLPPRPPARRIAVPGLDAREGLNKSGGSWETYLEILALYCGESERSLGETNKSFERGDLKTFTNRVHGIKSSSANVGAQTLSAIAGQLETAGKVENTLYIRENLPSFSADLEIMVTGIRGALSALENITNPQDGENLPA
jgi:signal transduction histidine kinase/HPt (histidine-containing phosphotransfer) domain-containing protein